MTVHATNSDDASRGYGHGGYGHGGYGHLVVDEPPSTDPEPTPGPDPDPINPDPDPSMPDDNDTEPIRLTATVSPEGDWPADMFRSEEEILEIVRNADLGGGSDIDPRRLDAVENRLDRLEELIHDLNTDEGVDEQRVRDLIREVGPDPSRINGLESTLEDLADVVDRLEAGAGGGDGTPVDFSDELAEIQRARRELELVGSPRHTRTVADGPHEDDDFHTTRDGNGIGAWGLVVTPEEDVHWREAAVHARDEGDTLLEIYTMDYEEGDTVEVGDRLMTREVSLNEGRQKVFPDVFLHRGQTFFITRDTADPTGDGVVPLKRGARDVDWGGMTSNIPLTIHCSWQLGRGGPGTSGYEDWRNNNWDQILHHFRDLEFGYNEED